VRAPRKDRWFGSIKILQDGRLHFSPWTVPDLPQVAVWDSSDRITVLNGGVQVLYLYLERRRVLSACFVYILRPDQLRDAVQHLREVQGGLAGWLVPALEWTQDHLSRVQPEADPRRALLKVIPELLQSCRDLPVANAWKRSCRRAQWKWVEHLREHSEEVDEVPSTLRGRVALKALEAAIERIKAMQAKPNEAARWRRRRWPCANSGYRSS
jgi:hypothetical protein